MTVQTLETSIVSEEMLEVLSQLSVEQFQQVLNFAKFLIHEKSDIQSQLSSEIENGISGNWVDRVSGSFKDDLEFEDVLRYGREFRESYDFGNQG